METLLVFLAIIAIQMIASYSKQKKEAEKKAQQRNAPKNEEQLEPVDEEYIDSPYEEPQYVPQESAPIPDPFKEIREALGLPPAEVKKEPVLEKEVPQTVVHAKLPEQDFKLEGIAPIKSMPFHSIADRKFEIDNKPEHKNLSKDNIEIYKLETNNSVNRNNLKQGIFWTAILQEPRYKVKWRAPYFPKPNL